MPRLDNSDPEVIGCYDLDYDPDDPGATPPADLCTDCYREGWDWPGDVALVIDHPPYAELEYTCLECGAPLTEDDD
jgi:hypothetical protein